MTESLHSVLHAKTLTARCHDSALRRLKRRIVLGLLLLSLMLIALSLSGCATPAPAVCEPLPVIPLPVAPKSQPTISYQLSVQRSLQTWREMLTGGSVTP